MTEGQVLPEGWEWKTLGEVCEKSEYGYTTSAKSEGTGLLFLRTTDISNGNIHWQSVPFCAEPPKDEERYRLKEGDLLIARAGSVGASVVIRNPPRSIFASYLIRFRPREELNSSYAGFFLKSNLYWAQLGSKTTGTTLPGVNATNLSKVKIPIPPLPTQRRIVSLLEKAEETKKCRAQADELTNKLLQSVFLEMFGDPEKNRKGWNIKSIEDLVEIDTKMINDFENYKEYPHIGIENIEKDTGRLIGYKKIKDLNIISGKYIFTKNHIIYSKIRPNLNKVALPTFSGLCSADAYPLLPYRDVCNKYFLAFVLRSDYFINYILRFSSRTNIPKVNKKQLQSFNCICPPIELQNKFSRIVEHVEQMHEFQIQSQQYIDILVNIFMQKAFKGELTA